MRLVILGSSGSIGRTAIGLVRGDPRFEVIGLAVNSSTEAALRDAVSLGAKHVAVVDAAAAEAAARDLPAGVTLHRGERGLLEVASLGADIVLCSIVGMAGLRPVLAAIDAGSDIALATKEVLVAAGEAVMKRRQERGVSILPVDSEHSAVFQALQGVAYDVFCCRRPGSSALRAEDAVSRLLLTASGGPFFFRPDIDFDAVTVEQALHHPKWSMGRKITVDSATMMNKGLEIMEARWLFNVPEERIEVLVHPESIVHSIVEFNDLTQIAELSEPDMAFAINYALSWPRRLPHNVRKPLDLARAGALHFTKPDEGRFPCLALAREALRLGGTAPAVLNAANEIAVGAFLDGRIRFSDIWRIVESVLSSARIQPAQDLDSVFAADADARAAAGACAAARAASR